MGKHQGKVLESLCYADGRGKMQIGKLLGITPSYISKLFKAETLSSEIIKKSCTLFGVEKSIFFDEGQEVFKSSNKKKSVDDYEERIIELEESIKRLAAELEREKAMTDTMRQALEKYFKSES